MFSRGSLAKQSFSKSSSKSVKPSSSFSKDSGISKRRHEPRRRAATATTASTADYSPTGAPSGVSPIVTLVVGHEHRIFAAHEHVLCHSPYFANSLKSDQITSPIRRIALPDESPEIFSSVLEYLYKGDYQPRLVHNKRRNSWELEQQPAGDDASAEPPAAAPAALYHQDPSCYGQPPLLKDTAVYCAADRYGLEELKRVALRKQGLRSGVPCATVLASARFAYANTPDTDSRLRAHYLALIIRSRATFKRSGTMQLEMFGGGTQLFFDLFVALCNHVDDVADSSSGVKGTPRGGRFR